MKKTNEVACAEESQSLTDGIEIGKWMGRREAFGLMAGRCAAADIESLRRIRDLKLYRQLNCTWAEYCTAHLRVGRRYVDRAIGYLEEFGPAYFHIAQMVHIGPKDYRSIAPHVNESGVNLDGAAIALVPENSDRVAAAVGELLKRIEPKPRATAPSFDNALKRCQAIAEALHALPERLDTRQKLELAEAVAGIRHAAAALGVALVDC